jgi:hypothetical protein
MNISAYILSCPDRLKMREQTLLNLAATDWHEEAWVEVDSTSCERRQERQEMTARRVLEKAVADGPDFIYATTSYTGLHLSRRSRVATSSAPFTIRWLSLWKRITIGPFSGRIRTAFTGASHYSFLCPQRSI